MNQINHIHLAKHFGCSLNTRSAVRSLWTEISKAIEKETVFSIRIDFKAVDFVSRNAMHELISLQRRLNNYEVTIVFENMSQQVQSMYTLVVDSKPAIKNSIITRHNITSIQEFNRVISI